MRTIPLLLAGALFALAIAPHDRAAAQAATAKAFVGGLEAGKSADPELVVLNTTSSSMTLDLVLRGTDGPVLADLPGSLTVGPNQTIARDLRADLAHAGSGGRAYVGVFSAEVSGEDPFAASTVVVHVTQYFGSRKKPKAAFVVRPLFSSAP